MAEISGQPIVNKADSVIASNLKLQDNVLNSAFSGAYTLWGVTLNGPNLTSGMNITGAFTASGRTNTAVGSGIFAPLGFFSAQVSGGSVVIPYFAA